jgi:hypothetical protein
MPLLHNKKEHQQSAMLAAEEHQQSAGQQRVKVRAQAVVLQAAEEQHLVNRSLT